MTNEELYEMWRASDEPNWLKWLEENIEFYDEEEVEDEEK